MTERIRLRDDGLEWREIDGELVLLDEATSRYVAGNPAAAVLWPLLAAGTTREDLAGALVERFGIENDRARLDADAFVDGLRERGMLASA